MSRKARWENPREETTEKKDQTINPPSTKRSTREKRKKKKDRNHRTINHFIRTMNNPMNINVEKYIHDRCLNREYIFNKCRTTEDSIIVPIYSLHGITWAQERFINPKDWIKSKTRHGSTWIFFLNGRDREKEILIVEWEIDFLSIIPYARNYNLMGIKGVSNLPTAIKEIEKLQKVYDVYILVDADEPADMSIARIPYTDLHLYDVRDALNGWKDVNDAIVHWMLNMDAIPKRIIKIKPIQKKINRWDSLDTVEKINEIPAIDVLESLFPQYRRHGSESIRENGKETHGYKYSKHLNMVSDFSWKWRPAWTTFMIAKEKFGDSHLTFLYFKWKL